jgi:uncharacterized protein HemX
MEPKLAEEIKDTVARELAKIQSFTEEQPVQVQAAEPLPMAEEVPAKSNGTFVAFLLAFVMLLVSGGVIAYMWQKNLKQGGPAIVAGRDGKDGMSPAELQNALKPFVDSTNKRLDVLEKRADASDKRMDIMSHRQWALSIAFNNNASIQEYNLRMTNPDHAGKIIWLDADWKLSKEPAFIQLTDADRRKLMEGIK